MSKERAHTAQTDAAGSPLPGEPAFLAVGKLRHAHGVRGEMFMEVFTDFPERIKPGIILYLGVEADQLKLTGCRKHREGLLLTFEGYSTPEALTPLRNQVVYVRAGDRPPLADGEYYQHQLIGLQVITDDGVIIGTVKEILETGASDVLVIRSESGREAMIPIVDAFIRDIDLARGVITAHLIPGMLKEA